MPTPVQKWSKTPPEAQHRVLTVYHSDMLWQLHINPSGEEKRSSSWLQNACFFLAATTITRNHFCDSYSHRYCHWHWGCTSYACCCHCMPRPLP